MLLHLLFHSRPSPEALFSDDAKVETDDLFGAAVTGNNADSNQDDNLFSSGALKPKPAGE